MSKPQRGTREVCGWQGGDRCLCELPELLWTWSDWGPSLSRFQSSMGPEGVAAMWKWTQVFWILDQGKVTRVFFLDFPYLLILSLGHETDYICVGHAARWCPGVAPK